MPYLVLGYRTGQGSLDPQEFVQQNGTEMGGWDLDNNITDTFAFDAGISESEMDGWDLDNNITDTFAFDAGISESEMDGWTINGPA